MIWIALYLLAACFVHIGRLWAIGNEHICEGCAAEMPLVERFFAFVGLGLEMNGEGVDFAACSIARNVSLPRRATCYAIASSTLHIVFIASSIFWPIFLPFQLRSEVLRRRGIRR